MNVQIVLDDRGEVCQALCHGNWSRDRRGNPCLDWWITLPDGDTYKQPLPVFDTWWPVAVELHTLEWGQNFLLDGIEYKYISGNGMYPWVTDINSDVRYSMHIATGVQPL